VHFGVEFDDWTATASKINSSYDSGMMDSGRVGGRESGTIDSGMMDSGRVGRRESGTTNSGMIDSGRVGGRESTTTDSGATDSGKFNSGTRARKLGGRLSIEEYDELEEVSQEVLSASNSLDSPFKWTCIFPHMMLLQDTWQGPTPFFYETDPSYEL
jgi:hypothetical protein